MKILEVKLMQHTPMIHFQYDQYGATLRASEVKPKLDRFLLTKLGGDKGYDEGFKVAKAKGWLVGNKGEHPALDYKVKIIAQDPVEKVQLKVERKGEKWKADFPMLLANIMGGGQKNKEDLRFFSMYKSITLYLYCGKDDLYGALNLDKTLPEFFSNTNFGQRSNKGFGSFTVEGPDLFGSIEEGTYYMDFRLKSHCDSYEPIYLLDNQYKLFKVIDLFWNTLRDSVKQDKHVRCDKIDNVQSYIKSMKHIEEYKGVDRMPAPIMFKPISYIDDKDNLMFSVYIMLDTGMLQRLKRSDIPNNFSSERIDNLRYINKFVSCNYREWKWTPGVRGVSEVEFYQQ